MIALRRKPDKLEGCCKAVRKAVDAKQVTRADAIAIRDLKPVDQERCLERVLLGKSRSMKSAWNTIGFDRDYLSAKTEMHWVIVAVPMQAESDMLAVSMVRSKCSLRTPVGEIVDCVVHSVGKSPNLHDQGQVETCCRCGDKMLSNDPDFARRQVICRDCQH